MPDQLTKKQTLHLTGHKVCLRFPFDDEMEIVRKWRNQDRVRKQFFNEKIIDKEAQQAWWAEHKRKQTDDHFMILTRDQRPVGFSSLYNFNSKTDRVEVGRLMIGDENDLDKGYMTNALELLIDYATTTIGMTWVYLNVKETNIAGIRCYTKVGFKEVSNSNGVITMEI